jgi:Tfp pilus assembly protein PilN
MVPQVNLLPPEIRASRSLARLKRVLALFPVLALVLGGAGYYWATTQVSAANAELEEAQAESTRLLSAQLEYAEVPQVLSELESARQARLLGSSTEILWTPYLAQLVATLPPGVAFEEISMTGATPMVLGAVPASALAEQGTATLTFVGRTPVVPDIAAWIEALETIPDFSDVYITAASINEEDVDGALVSFYRVSGSVGVGEGALAQRFVEQEDQE